MKYTKPVRKENKLYKTSRWVHKYPGLLLLLFFIWMSISGVLLNHPEMLKNLSVPQWFVPEHYHPDNWNRRTLKGIVYSGEGRDTLIAYGNQGIYRSTDKGMQFSSFMAGEFPTAAWKKRTNHLFFNKQPQLLLSATNDGLLTYDFEHSAWQIVTLPDRSVPILKIIRTEDRLVLIAKSCFYVSRLDTNLTFTKHIPSRTAEDEHVSLIQVFLELHDGSIWGFPGKMLWDVAGVVLLFLCVSAFYIWYYPKKWKWQYKKNNSTAPPGDKKSRHFFFRYHKTLGWYAAVLLLIIFFTGTFLRPPLMIIIAEGKLPEKYYPAIQDSNPWEKKIRNALYDSVNKQIVLDCTDGIWTGSLTENKPFIKKSLPVRIFAMGATVFEEEKPGTWLIGSFGGLERFNVKEKSITPVLQSKSPVKPGRPASTLVNGRIIAPDSTEYILGHYKGICDTEGNRISNAFVMPEQIKKQYRMPFWNFLFELHNGRIFKGVLGSFYILVIPVGGIIGLLILLSGIFDYWFIKPKSTPSALQLNRGINK